MNKIKPILTQKGWEIVEGEIDCWKNRNLTIKCNQGHKWPASPQSVKHNNCPECTKHCYDKEKHMKRIIRIVESRDGEIISGSYQNGNSIFVVKCEKGDKWETTASRLKNGKWCSTCHGRNKVTQFKRIQKTAVDRGGKCISNEYFHKERKWNLCV
ncbi:hypothetical protein CV093_04420 [Oceanobacillus sp. 143]|nr:hypothetical protein CV093_04420 [Oceanobacillus sp. 143]